MSRITVRTLLVIGSIAVAGGGVSQAQSSFIRGDANQSSRVNLFDALALLEHLFAGGAERLRCLDAGDANDDGRLNVTDAVFLLSFLFGGANDLPQPYPECGKDPTADALRCASFERCLSGEYRVLWMGGGAEPYDLNNSAQVAVNVPDCGPGTLPADEELGCANPPDCQ